MCCFLWWYNEITVDPDWGLQVEVKIIDKILFRLWKYSSQTKYYRTSIWPLVYFKLWQVNIYGNLDDKNRHNSHFITCCRFTTTTIFIISVYYSLCSSTLISQVVPFQWRFKWQMIWFHKPFRWHDTIDECCDIKCMASYYTSQYLWDVITCQCPW